MKKILVVIIVSLFTVTSSSAQTEQGRIGVYGSASLSMSGSSATTGSTYTLSIAPSVLYFVVDGLAIGPGISVYFREKDRGPFQSAGLSMSVSYYLGKETLKPFTTLSGGYSSFQDKLNAGAEFHGGSWSVGTAIGLAYFISPSVALVNALRYSHGESTDHYTFASDPGTLHKSDSQSNNLALTFGVTYILPK
jgi:hypothetical protein